MEAAVAPASRLVRAPLLATAARSTAGADPQLATAALAANQPSVLAKRSVPRLVFGL